MLQFNLMLFQEAADRLEAQWHDTTAQSIPALMPMYERARRRGRIGRIWSLLTGRSRRLLDLDAVERRCTVRARRTVGMQAVPIDRIRGSEGRCQDFDCSFYPLDAHARDRWLSVAIARQMGLALPPVALIQVGDVYFVRDGHHRISVARARGQHTVDAFVTAWDVAGPLPWEQEAMAGSLAGQPV